MEAKKRQCTATSKRSGERCQKPPLKGATVCQMHGGKSPKGLAHPSTTHGRYSKDLLLCMARDYEAGTLDPNALTLSHEIGLSTALIQQVLRNAQLPAFWDELYALYEKASHLYIDGLIFLNEQPAVHELIELLARPEGGELGRTLGELGAQIEKGRDRFSLDTPTVEIVTKLLEGRRRLVESENKRYGDQGWLWTFAQVQAYVGRIISCVRRHVPEETLARIADDLRDSNPPVASQPAGQVNATAE